MAKIIEPAHRVRIERKVRLFEFLEDRNCGFQFDVVDGSPVFPTEAAKRNFEHCLSHPEEYEDKGIVTLEISGWQDAKAICECGKTILLYNAYHGACQCEHCGRWHNLFGQELLPPEYWDMSGDEE